LKGAYFIRTLYRDAAGTRVMSDIDVLVMEKDVATADKVLASLGYQYPDAASRGGRKARMYFSRKKDPSVSAPVHLHWHIVNISAPFLKINWAGIDMREIWERSAPPGGNDGTNVRVMSPEHMILALASHGLSHGFSRIDLLYDMYSYIAHHRDAVSWGGLLDNARRWGLAVPLYTALLLTETAFKTTGIPPGFFDSLRPEGISLLERYFIRHVSKNDRPRDDNSLPLYLAMNSRLRDKMKFIFAGLSLRMTKAYN